MNRPTHSRTLGKPLRLMICAALAVAMTGLTTQVIVSSPGMHQYQIASTRLPPASNFPDSARRMTLAQVR
ncbi:MAG: hypothetical protein ACHQDB_10440 [Steroidobacterales bacterium]